MATGYRPFELALPSQYAGVRLPFPHFWHPLLPASYPSPGLRGFIHQMGAMTLAVDNGDKQEDVEWLLAAGSPGVKKGLVVRGVYHGTDPRDTSEDAARIANLRQKMERFASWGYIPDVVFVDIENYRKGAAPSSSLSPAEHKAWIIARRGKFAKIRTAISEMGWSPNPPMCVYSAGWVIPVVNERTGAIAPNRSNEWIDDDDPSSAFHDTVLFRPNSLAHTAAMYEMQTRQGIKLYRRSIVPWIGEHFTNAGLVSGWEGLRESRALGNYIRDLRASGEPIEQAYLYPAPNSLAHPTSTTYWGCLSNYVQGLLEPRVVPAASIGTPSTPVGARKIISWGGEPTRD